MSPILYLDVRSAEEFAERHRDDSRNVPLDQLPPQLSQLGSKQRPIVVYCRSGRRSALAAAILREAGFTRVTDVGSLERAEAT
jgi:phage shock protein E